MQFQDFFLKNIRMEKDIEKVLEHLSRKGLSDANIYARLQMPRGTFYARRQSTKEITREALAEKIIQAYPDQFPNGEIPTAQEPEIHYGNPTTAKYIALLENQLKDANADREWLRHLLNETFKEIKALLAEIKKQ